jgi:hypothetical protein
MPVIFLAIMYAMMGVLTFAMFCLSVDPSFVRSTSEKAGVLLALYFSVATVAALLWPAFLVVRTCFAARLHVRRSS